MILTMNHIDTPRTLNIMPMVIRLKSPFLKEQIEYLEQFKSTYT